MDEKTHNQLDQERLDRPYTKRLVWSCNLNSPLELPIYETAPAGYFGRIQLREQCDWTLEVYKKEDGRLVFLTAGYADSKTEAQGKVEHMLANCRRGDEGLRSRKIDRAAANPPAPAAPSPTHHKPVTVPEIRAEIVGHSGLIDHFGFHLLENGSLLFDPLFVAMEAIRLAKKGGLR